ncbi:MAG: putative oxidoreductase [Desertimonas sp.]|nr:putative oxidoreductase [Desertimonas sp.]
MGDLAGRVAVVTGGSRGIGRAIAEAYVEAGAQVTITGTTQDKGDQAIGEIAKPDDTMFVRAGAKVRADCERAIDETVDRFGKVDILVNNAGGASNHAPVADLTDEALDNALRWNLWSTFWSSRHVVKPMIERGWGRIINVSSLEGKVGKPGIAIYVTAKHAVNGLTKSMAQELGTTGVTVNSLCPGAIETDIMQAEGPGAAEAMGITYQQLLDHFAQESAIKRLNSVEEVAAVALLLASDAGSGITGSLISIDGGSSPY